jgi:PadR family transcriptional regulator PadR
MSTGRDEQDRVALAAWCISDNNRRARFYTLTKAGRKQLTAETRQWKRLASAIGRILGAEET